MPLSPLFEKAVITASIAHRTQTMKGSETPYMAHILGVAGITALYGGTEDEIIAALLHDSIEDTDLTAEHLAGWFGPETARIVEECTDAVVRPKPPWHRRKQKHIAEMRTASPSARFVYAADKLQNARAMLKDYRVVAERLWGRFNGGKEGTFWYYFSLIDVFRETNTAPELVDEVERTVDELARLAHQDRRAALAWSAEAGTPRRHARR